MPGNLEDGKTRIPIPQLPAHGGCHTGLKPESMGLDKKTGTRYAGCPTPMCKWSFMLRAGATEWTGKVVKAFSLSNVDRMN